MGGRGLLDTLCQGAYECAQIVAEENMGCGGLGLQDCNTSLFECLQSIPCPAVEVLESRLLNPLPATHPTAQLKHLLPTFTKPQSNSFTLYIKRTVNNRFLQSWKETNTSSWSHPTFTLEAQLVNDLPVNNSQWHYFLTSSIIYKSTRPPSTTVE
jgi:hypothetical protein